MSPLPTLGRNSPASLSSLVVRFEDEEGRPRPSQHGNRLYAGVAFRDGILQGDPDAISSVTDDCGGTWTRVADTWVRGSLDGGVVAVTFTLAGAPAIELWAGEATAEA